MTAIELIGSAIAVLALVAIGFGLTGRAINAPDKGRHAAPRDTDRDATPRDDDGTSTREWLRTVHARKIPPHVTARIQVAALHAVLAGASLEDMLQAGPPRIHVDGSVPAPPGRPRPATTMGEIRAALNCGRCNDDKGACTCREFCGKDACMVGLPTPARPVWTGEIDDTGWLPRHTDWALHAPVGEVDQ